MATWPGPRGARRPRSLPRSRQRWTGRSWRMRAGGTRVPGRSGVTGSVGTPGRAGVPDRGRAAANRAERVASCRQRRSGRAGSPRCWRRRWPDRGRPPSSCPGPPSARAAHIRRLGPMLVGGQQPVVRRVVTSRPTAGVMEVSVVVGFGPRVRALALRLERALPPALPPPGQPMAGTRRRPPGYAPRSRRPDARPRLSRRLAYPRRLLALDSGAPGAGVAVAPLVLAA